MIDRGKWDPTGKLNDATTLQETNIAPENRASQKEISSSIDFQGLC